MATSTCVKCGSTSFEVVEARPKGSKHNYLGFVQCSKCGGVIGVIDPLNIGSMLEEIREHLGIREV